MDQEKPKQIHGCLVLILIFAVLSLIDVRLMTNLLFARYEREKSVQITESVPDMFPVLVLTKNSENEDLKPTIVFYKYLPEYIKSHSDYTYLIPQGNEKELNAQLKGYDFDSGYGVGQFHIVEKDGKETIKVEGRWEDQTVNLGWYEAENRAITPLKHLQYSGPLVTAAFFVHIVIGNILASLLVYVGYKYFMNLRARYQSKSSDESQ